MAPKALLAFFAQSLLIQAAFGQYIRGNSLVDNDIFVNTGAYSGLGLGLADYGLLGGLDLASLGGYGLGNGLGYISGNSLVDNSVLVNSGAYSGLGFSDLGLVGGLGYPSLGGLGVVSGNSVVDNTVVVNSGAYSGLGLGNDLGVLGGLGYAGLGGLGVISGNSVVDNTVLVNSGAYSGLGLSGLGSGLGYVSGNSIVDNNIVVNTAAVSGLGYGLGIPSVPVGVDVFGGYNTGFGLNTLVSSPAFVDLSPQSFGGVFQVTSSGPIVPTGICVVSENVIEGVLYVSGQLPFLSAVGLEGAIATGGAGAASCGCGNGNIGIVSEGGSAGILPALGGLGLGGLGGYGYVL